MAYTLACKDFGVECPYVARGDTNEELWEDASKHLKEAHGYTNEQLNDPKLKEEAKPLIKQA